MKNLHLLFFAGFLACFVPFLAYGQSTVVPLEGIGNVQFLDNSAKPLTAGVLYSFQAGTSVQQATFTDSTGTAQNTNPIAFGAGARANIWLVSGQFYKFVLCAQNDGPVCAAGDTLFSVDNVPATTSSGGGGGGAPFITSSPNPATSGVLRLASGDLVCWRNAAGSGNLCFSKDTNDVLSWAGGQIKLPEVGAPTCAPGFDFLWADSTAHTFKLCGNGNPAATVVFGGSGFDISGTSQVVQLHFGSAALPLSSTAPTTGQSLEWNGTNIVGVTVNSTESTLSWTTFATLTGTSCTTSLSNPFCAQTVLSLAHTLNRMTYVVGTGPSGCTTNAVIGVRDVTAASNLVTSTVTAASGTFVDSGALSVSMPAGHTYLIGVLTVASGCGANPTAGMATMVFQ